MPVVTYDIVNIERQLEVGRYTVDNKIRFELELCDNFSSLAITVADEYVMCSKKRESEFIEKGKYPLKPVLNVLCDENMNSDDSDDKSNTCGKNESGELVHTVYLEADAYKQLINDLNAGNFPKSVTFEFSENLLRGNQFITLNGKQAECIQLDAMHFSLPYIKKQMVFDEIFSMLVNTNVVNRLILIMLVIIALIQSLSFLFELFFSKK